MNLEKSQCELWIRTYREQTKEKKPRYFAKLLISSCFEL